MIIKKVFIFSIFPSAPPFLKWKCDNYIKAHAHNEHNGEIKGEKSLLKVNFENRK
jgi:hypothetical protein